MFDLFGIRKRKAEKEAAEKLRKKKILDDRDAKEQARKDFISDFLSKDRESRWERGRKLQKEDQAEVEKANTTCPVCGSHSRIHKFVRIQGSLDGKIHGSHTSYPGFLGSGGGHGSVNGSIHGELDTHKINECRDCGNQWEIKEPRYSSAYDYVCDHLSLSSHGSVGYVYRKVEKVFEENGWPEDWISSLGSFEAFRNAPREVIEYLFYLHHVGEDDENKIFRTPIHTCLGYENYNDGEYLFEFSDEDWDLICKVLKKGKYASLTYKEIQEM